MTTEPLRAALSPPPTRGRPSQLRVLVGSGHRIALFALPFALLGAALELSGLGTFALGPLAPAQKFLALCALTVGLSIWAWSVVLILVRVPRGELITTGPYAWVKHPLYTSVALLVAPSAGFLLQSWLGVLLGVALYIGSRLFSPEEERDLARAFGSSFEGYAQHVKFPWL